METALSKRKVQIDIAIGHINDLISYISGTSFFLWFTGILRGTCRAGTKQLLHKSLRVVFKILFLKIEDSRLLCHKELVSAMITTEWHGCKCKPIK